MAQRSDNTVENPGGPGVPASVVPRDPTQAVAYGGDPRIRTPFIDPKIADPVALQYAHNAEQRRRGQVPVPKYNQLVAGGADVPIPRLDSEFQAGATMAQQAMMQRAPAGPIPENLRVAAGIPTQVAGGIVTGQEHTAPAAPPASTSRTAQPSLAGLMQDDLLPPEASQDPVFQPGMGSQYATSQPHLARKYGVIRKGKHVPGQQLGAPSGGKGGAALPGGKVRPETLEGLEALERLSSMQHAPADPDSDENIERAAQEGPAGRAGLSSAPLSKQDKARVLEDFDEFDINKMREATFKDLLNNDTQRKIVEERLKPLDLTALITTGTVTQVVPIVPGQFYPTYQAYSGDEDLQLKRLIGQEVRSNQVTDQYALDKYTLMGVTIAIVACNGAQLPDYRDANGKFNEEMFWKKFEIVSKWNFHMLSSLAVHWFWFDVRVRKLFRAETLGNG